MKVGQTCLSDGREVVIRNKLLRNHLSFWCGNNSIPIQSTTIHPPWYGRYGFPEPYPRFFQRLFSSQPGGLFCEDCSQMTSQATEPRSVFAPVNLRGLVASRISEIKQIELFTTGYRRIIHANWTKMMHQTTHQNGEPFGGSLKVLQGPTSQTSTIQQNWCALSSNSTIDSTKLYPELCRINFHIDDAKSLD